MDARIELTFNGKTELLYSSAANDDKSALINPQVKAEIGKAGSLTFTILPTHPMYDDLKPFLTFLRVEIDGTEIFNGRVLETSKDMYNQKNVTCEGDLTYLLDSVCEPGDYNETVTAFFRRCINWHNSKVENAKKFQIGDVTIEAKNANVNFDVSNYTSIGDLLETEVIGYYGGYLRTRNQNGSRYIDIVQEGDSSSNQVIEYGSQMLDLTNDESANDLFTILLAVGDGDSTDGSDYNFPTYTYEVPGAVAKYGRITHVESFSGIKNSAELEPLAREYVRTHYDPYPTELTIKAIDLHMIDGSIQTIIVGNTVKIQSTPHNLSKNLMCVSIDYDLENPENTSYVFGHPKQSLSQRLNKDKKRQDSNTSKAGKSGGKAGGGVKNEEEERKKEDAKAWVTIDEHTGKITAQAESIEANAKNILLRVTYDDVVNAINISKEGIKIKASKITFDGPIIASELAKLSGVTVKSLTSTGAISATGTVSSAKDVIATKGFTTGSETAVWQNVTCVYNVSYNTGSAYSVVLSGGQIAGAYSFDYVSSVKSKEVQFHYLGRKPVYEK